MGIVGDVVPTEDEEPTPLLPAHFRKVAKKRVDLAKYEHASDVKQGSWFDRHMMINSLNIGDESEQEKPYRPSSVGPRVWSCYSV